MRDVYIMTDEAARARRWLEHGVVTPPEVREGLRVVDQEEGWMLIGDRYVIVQIPNGLKGVRINEEGEAV